MKKYFFIPVTVFAGLRAFSQTLQVGTKLYDPRHIINLDASRKEYSFIYCKTS